MVGFPSHQHCVLEILDTKLDWTAFIRRERRNDPFSFYLIAHQRRLAEQAFHQFHHQFGGEVARVDDGIQLHDIQ